MRKDLSEAGQKSTIAFLNLDSAVGLIDGPSPDDGFDNLSLQDHSFKGGDVALGEELFSFYFPGLAGVDQDQIGVGTNLDRSLLGVETIAAGGGL